MTSQHWDADDRLLEELAAALKTTRPLSQQVGATGEAAYTWHGIDAELELASLVYDSSLDAEAVVRGAGDETRRRVQFETPTVSVELERSGDTVVGQIVPGGPGTVSVAGASGLYTATADVDELGCFGFDALPAEPVRLRWCTPTVNLVTDWVRL